MLGNLLHSEDINRHIDAAITPPTLRMDYEQIDNVRDREILRSAAFRIREAVDTAKWVVGSQLIQAKRDVTHGSWLTWLQQEFDWTERSAQNYMSMARLIEQNEQYAELPATAQSTLGRQDADIIDQVGPDLLSLQERGAGSGRNGKVNQDDVRRMVDEAKGKPKATPKPSIRYVDADDARRIE